MDLNQTDEKQTKPAWLTRKEYTSPAEKKKDFWLGVGLWFGLNILMTLCSWGISALLFSALSSGNYDTSFDIYSIVSLVLGTLPLLINIGLIVYFAFTRSQIALVMLAGFGIALLSVVCLCVIFTEACFVILSNSGY